MFFDLSRKNLSNLLKWKLNIYHQKELLRHVSFSDEDFFLILF